MERRLRFVPTALICALLAIRGSLGNNGATRLEHGSFCRCVPDQWEGVLSSVEREFDMKEDATDTLENSIRVHYDFVNRRCAMTDLNTGKKALIDYQLVSIPLFLFTLISSLSFNKEISQMTM